MEKEFIPYGQALALKELGFDGECFGHYENQNKKLVIYYSNLPLTDEEKKRPLLYQSKTQNTTLPQWATAAPLYQQIFRWFRKEHNLYVTFENYQHGEPTDKLPEGNTFHIEEHGHCIIGKKEIGFLNTYDEAEIICLNKLIEIVKKNKQDE